MKKIAIAALASIFFFGSSVTMASGGEATGNEISAEDMSNFIRCKDKKPGESVKSSTRVENGKIPKIKCADANKIVNDARAKAGK